MKFFIGLLFILLSNCVILGQANWLFLQGANYDDEGKGIVIDSKGYIYVIGLFRGSVDFDPGADVDLHSSAPGTQDRGFIQKFHPDQSLMWLKVFGSGLGELTEIQDVIIDDHDHIYIAGSFVAQPNFSTGGSDSILISQSSSDGFVAKYTEHGDLIWAKGLEGYGIQRVNDLAVDTEDNLYLTGRFRENIDLDPNTGVAIETEGASTGYQDFNGFMAKWNSDGEYIWGNSFAAQHCSGEIIEVDENGNIYLAGYFKGDLDIDFGAETEVISRSSSSGYILKMDPMRNLIWGKVLDGESNGSYQYGSGFTALALDYDGNIYLGGGFSGVTYFGYGDTTYNFTAYNTHSDAFIQKLDGDGNYQWTKVFGSSSSDNVTDLKTTNDGQLYSTGSFYGSVVFNDSDPSSTVVSQSIDIFAMSWGLDGSFNWVKTFGGVCDYSRPAAIVHDNNQNLYGTGMYKGSLEPAPSQYIFGYGGTDCIVFKIGGQLDVPELELETTFIVYPNPAQETLTIQLNSEENVDRIEILDMTGRVVTSERFSHELSLKSLEAGPYILRLWKTNEIYGTRKVIIE